MHFFLQQTNHIVDVWPWLETTVVRGLFKEKLYNGDNSIRGFTQDYYSNVFGGARLRQIRVQAGK